MSLGPHLLAPEGPAGPHTEVSSAAFGSCAQHFCLGPGGHAATTSSRHTASKKFDCAGRKLTLTNTFKVSKHASRQSDGGGGAGAAQAAAGGRWHFSVRASLKGPGMPGVEAEVRTWLTDEKGAILSKARRQLPLDAFRANRGKKVFKVSLAEVARRIPSSGSVRVTVTANVRRFRPSVDHSTTLVKALSEMYQSGSYSDVTLICSGQSLKCHKVILAAKSKVFASMFGGDFIEAKQNHVVIDDVEAKTMKALLNYVYRGELKRSEASVKLLATAHKYDIQDLVNECCNVLSLCLNNASIYNILHASYLYDREFLFKYAVMYFEKNKKVLMQGGEWKKLAANPDLLISILMEI